MEYEYILVNKEEKKYLGWSLSKIKPISCEDMEWILWGKNLPDDIDSMRSETGDSLYYYDKDADDLVLNGEK